MHYSKPIMTLLSVHLITYNNEQHIEDTLKSILKQIVDFNYEIVVGDDCSTDNTLKIINKYAALHPNLFKVHKNAKQQGILKNFKATLDRCHGTFIFDIAGDDMLKSDYALQKMVNVLNNDTSLGFVDSGFDSYYDNTKKTIFFKNKSILNSSKESYKEALLLGKIAPIGHCYRREYLIKFVDFDTYLSMKITIEDYPILVDLSMHTNFETIKESLHIYRVHNESYSHKKCFKNHFFLKNQMKNLFEYFNKKYQYNDDIVETFNTDYNKELLFLAGYFEEKDVGKNAYKKIKSKNIKDYIHYFASQNTFFRKLISFLKPKVK
ncbi:glycosyltransferase family 2 protein [Mariniflexile aquimaris]|uniref:Glycosyltransferase family 2 protein n=1 Tax=Mariniflexile aquimaris TaxID=881009 RepID=A0ABW3BXM5_9FLAO